MESRLNYIKNQIEDSIDVMGNILDEREFQDFCDNAYSNISYVTQCIIKLKHQKQNGDKENQH